MAPITLRLLGGFDLWCDGERVPLALASQRLVAFLALHDRPVLRPYVAGSLWLDTSQDQASARLRATLWRLRNPPFPVVETTVTHIQLGRTVVVDVRELVAAAHRMMTGAAPSDEVDDSGWLDGDLLPDWYDDWLEPERERLRQLRLRLVEEAAERALADGHPAYALDLALRALGTEPLRESLHALVIRSHLAQGNRSSAVRHHDSYAARMASELGLAPSPEIAQLLEGACGERVS